MDGRLPSESALGVHNGFHGNMGAGFGMLIVETISKIHRGVFCSEEADQGDLPGAAGVAQSGAQGEIIF
jgi:hypothetical protein